MSVDPTTVITYCETSQGVMKQESVTVLGATHEGTRVVSLQFEFDPGCRTMSAASARKMAHMLMEASK